MKQSKKKVSIGISISLISSMVTIIMLTLMSVDDSVGLSMKISVFIAEKILVLFNGHYNQINPALYDTINLFIRKLGHMFEYSLLYFIFYLLFNRIGFKRFKLHGSALAAIVLFASIDETIQHFVSKRNGNYIDVLVDFTGALVAMIFILIYKRIKSRC